MVRCLQLHLTQVLAYATSANDVGSLSGKPYEPEPSSWEKVHSTKSRSYSLPTIPSTSVETSLYSKCETPLVNLNVATNAAAGRPRPG